MGKPQRSVFEVCVEVELDDPGRVGLAWPPEGAHRTGVRACRRAFSSMGESDRWIADVRAAYGRFLKRVDYAL